MDLRSNSVINKSFLLDKIGDGEIWRETALCRGVAYSPGTICGPCRLCYEWTVKALRPTLLAYIVHMYILHTQGCWRGHWEVLGAPIRAVPLAPAFLSRLRCIKMEKGPTKGLSPTPGFTQSYPKFRPFD